MKTALEILRTFRRMGTAPVCGNIIGVPVWYARSQYGYTMSTHRTRKDALRAVLSYYGQRMRLIRQ